MVALEASDFRNMADFFDPGRQSSSEIHTRCPDTAIPPREKLSFYFEGGFERKKHMLTHRALYLEIFSLSNPSHRSFYIAQAIILRKIQEPIKGNRTWK